jgi:hypothetical protein
MRATKLALLDSWIGWILLIVLLVVGLAALYWRLIG